MPCEICSQRCSGSRCKTCRMLERQEEFAKAGAEKSDDVPTCADCGADVIEGAYAPDRVGVLLCQDCHPDPDNGRKPAGGGRVVAMTDGGVEQGGHTELHIPEDDAVILTARETGGGTGREVADE